MKYLIRSVRFNYLLDFDGNDYRWTRHREQAWIMSRMDATLHYNRLSAYVHDAAIEEG